jgi:hypothetical protein
MSGHRRLGLFGFGRLAERVGPIEEEERPLCVLLLPRTVEEMGERIEELLASPAVVAVEPSRLPDALAEVLAVVQARRLRLPGRPRAIAVFDARQHRLARALQVLYPNAELWYDTRDNEVIWDGMERVGII